MRDFLRHQSIKTKLTILLMLISVILLMVVSTVVLVSEVYQSRSTLIRELRVLSNAFAANTRQSLVLGKHKDAERILAGLSTQRHIHAAYLFDQEGKPVAQYLSGYHAPLVWKALQREFGAGHVELLTSNRINRVGQGVGYISLLTPIYFDHDQVGTIYVLSDMDPVFGRISGVVFAISFSLLFLFGCSWWLAGRLQKPVSEPIMGLAGVMKQITEGQQYTLRARKINNDEIGDLVEIFNRMLNQIEVHQQQQQLYQQQLECEVMERTSELRETLVDLEVAREQADAANKEKSLFLSRMTHELRTPLIGVIGMNGLLMRTPLSEQQQQMVQTIHTSGEDLLTLISDVLDIARIETGRIFLEYDDMDLCQTVEEVADLLAVKARQKGLQLLVDIPFEALWRVQADRLKISQILMNLVGNAIKFTLQGSVTLRVAYQPQTDQKGLFRIAVEDTGVGMSESDSRRVFDLFYQLDNQATDSHSGSGLGLAIVRQLVDLMDGSLEVASSPGQGSTFRVELPLPLVARRELSMPTGLLPQPVLVWTDGGPDKQQQILLSRLRELRLHVETVDSLEGATKFLNSAGEQGLRLLLVIDQRHLQTGNVAALLSGQDLDLLLLCSDHEIESVAGTAPAGQFRLGMPLTWERLAAALNRSAQERESKVAATVADAVVLMSASVPRPYRVLLVGHHPALRRLLHMALSGRGIDLESVDGLPSPAAGHRLEPYDLIFIDGDDFSLAEISAFLKPLSERLPPCYLLCQQIIEEEPIDRTLFAGILEKPLNPENLHSILDKLSHGVVYDAGAMEPVR